jgi:hypothetical protein
MQAREHVSRTISAHLKQGSDGWKRYPPGTALPVLALVFLCSYFILFFGMSRHPIVYDEGLILTAAMRVAAGQLPHRDFYANYGPAQFYLIAGLFKLFGESVLIERIFDFFLKALVVTSAFAIASAYCRRSIAVGVAVITVSWLFFLSGSGSTIIPVSLLNLIASALVLPVFAGRVSARRMFAAGAVAGAATLFRYDTGVALLGINAFIVSLAIYLKGGPNRLRTVMSALWPYLLAFAVVTLPPALYYLSVAPVQPFIHDIVLYPARYYHRGRNLPFPAITLIGLENLEIYLPIAVIAISLYVAVARLLSTSDKDGLDLHRRSGEQDWHGFLFTFAILALVMYFKGLVRVSIAQMYLSFLPSFLLLAVLFEHRSILPRLVRVSIMSITWLSVVAATWGMLHELKLLYVQHLSVPEWLLSSSHGTMAETNGTWCKTPNPLTKGICFLPEKDRIQAIEFIDSHTRPDQELYVGLPRHDRVFVNDNILYFATQRMPATKWSHFDPFLQNRLDIQTQMVHELDVNAPPYIVLDSEWDSISEPNESSKSSGVTLLDEYIRKKYQYTTSFGQLSIWRRIRAS